MSALGQASLGTQCADKALGQASLGLFCGDVLGECEGLTGLGLYALGLGLPDCTEAPSRTTGGEPDFKLNLEQIRREDEDVIAIIMAGINAGII